LTRAIDVVYTLKIEFMPRYLYLLRHAQSAEKQIGQTDKDRELTPVGMKQSIRVASYLMQQKTFPQSIICSAAERTKATATLIADALKLEHEVIHFTDDLYEASVRTLMQTVSQLEDNLHHVLCVAHNPSVSYFAEYLTKAEIGEMVPAGMAIIEFESNSWREVAPGGGKLISYVEPDKITQ
jgi:phosphohistidine phosphatase